MKATLVLALAGFHVLLVLLISCSEYAQVAVSAIGHEVAVPAHLQNGDEFAISVRRLIQYGETLFNAKFTVQEGAGRAALQGDRRATV
jgi:hypothetical protein